jgi:hypothetical protein
MEPLAPMAVVIILSMVATEEAMVATEEVMEFMVVMDMVVEDMVTLIIVVILPLM